MEKRETKNFVLCQDGIVYTILCCPFCAAAVWGSGAVTLPVRAASFNFFREPLARRAIPVVDGLPTTIPIKGKEGLCPSFQRVEKLVGR